MKLRLALGQMDLSTGRPEANLHRAQDLAREAACLEAELLVLPELWLSGYDLPRSKEHADAFGSEYRARWAALAREAGLYMAGSVLELDAAGRPANTALVLSPQGDVSATYRKVHLFEPVGEKRHLAPGHDTPCFDLPWGTTALALCYDLRFPEVFRRFMRQGATLVLLSAQWPQARTEHWRILLQARAIENQFFLAACNRAGRDPDGTSYAGHSCVVGPWGEILVEGKEDAALLVADLDLDQVPHVRRKFPVLEDIRKDLFG